MNKMWILADFENALIQLRSALSQPANKDLLRAGCIQYFDKKHTLILPKCA